jgi:hypothetical protein
MEDYMAYQHHYDKDGKKSRRGDSAEKRFVRIGKQRGWKVQKSTYQENREKHIDYWIANSDKRIRTAVKAIKKTHGSRDPDDTIQLLEVVGKNNTKGWLFGSKADWLIQETGAGFYIYSIRDAIKYAKELLKERCKLSDVKWSSKDNEPYQVYKRYQNDGDRFLYVPLVDFQKHVKPIDFWDDKMAT